MTILKNGLKIEVTNTTNNEQLNYIEAFNFYNLKNKDDIDKEDKESLNYIDTGDKEYFKKCQKYDIIKIKVNNNILGTTEIIDTEVLRDDARIPFIRIYCGVLYKNLEKPLGKMIGSQETYTEMSKILKDTLNNMNNHYEDTDRLLEDAGFHQDQDFLIAEYKKHEQVMKHYDNIIKELKEFINTVDTDIDEFDKTMKDNREACDEEKMIESEE